MNVQSTPDNIFIRKESNVRSYCRSFPVVFGKAEGSFIWGEDGKKYIDFFAGAGALNYGHNPKEVRDKLIDYLSQGCISHSLDMHTRAKRDFLSSFDEIILKPRNLPHRVMFPGPTGTNAVESAMKVARLSTKRSKVASFTNGFHGMTLGALSATGSKYSRDGAGSSLSEVDRYFFDGYFGSNVDTIDMVEKLLLDPSSGYEPPAAFLVETVQAEGGINVASLEWLRNLSKLAKKVGSLLIIDDIQVGCGRTGRFFSFEEAGIVPDIICLSKSISGYGLPMSLVLISPEHDVMTPGQHNGTFRGNNLAFVAATQTLNFWKEGGGIVNQALEGSQVIVEALNHLVSKCGAGFSVRGRGMIQGLVCPSGDIASAISEKSFKKGLIIETCGPTGEVVKLSPSLNIPQGILSEGLSILNDAALSVSAFSRD